MQVHQAFGFENGATANGLGLVGIRGVCGESEQWRAGCVRPAGNGYIAVTGDTWCETGEDESWEEGENECGEPHFKGSMAD